MLTCLNILRLLGIMTRLQKSVCLSRDAKHWEFHGRSCRDDWRAIPIADGAQRQWNGVPFLWRIIVLAVDEAACAGNTDYNYTTTLGREGSYKVDLSSIPDGSTINKIIVSVCASA